MWAQEDGTIWIKDVKPVNGTRINGQRLTPADDVSESYQLHHNDKLQLRVDLLAADEKTITCPKIKLWS